MPALEIGGLKELWSCGYHLQQADFLRDTAKCEKTWLKEEMKTKLNHCNSYIITGTVTTHHVTCLIKEPNFSKDLYFKYSV